MQPTTPESAVPQSDVLAQEPPAASGDGSDQNRSEVVGAESTQLDVAPVRPPADIRREFENYLESDNTRVGEVYRGLLRGLDADAIARELEVESSNFVWNYTRMIKALVEGELPTAPTVALAVARKFRTVLKSKSLSPLAQKCLNTNLSELERRANDETARVIEVENARGATEQAEAKNEVGIYVYALPHYIRYPFDPDTGRTLMKVGRSDSDIIERFRNQTRTTALPEEPILLRIYRTGSVPKPAIEASFHRLLEAADHYRSVAKTAGREWFVTSTRFLDELARVMSLPLVVVNDGVPDED